MADHEVSATGVGSPLITLSAGVETSVEFARDLTLVEVISNGGGALWYTLDGSVPAVDGETSFYIPTGGGVDRRDPVGATSLVRLISDSAPTVRVQRGY
jgi:hypothetical protein